jgi:CheY-like chemotaxis protein
VIAVSVRSVPESDEVEIAVRDSGSGIAQENLSKIFDPFFTTKAVGKGTGLGLSICYNLVKAAEGRLEVESKEGVGSTFKVRLPIAKEGALPKGDAALDAPRNKPGVRRALVIDDDLFVARSLQRILSPPHDVSIAISAVEALRLLANESFDAVFCDVMMPGTSGLDVYDAVAAYKPDLARRFVFITGGAFSSDTHARLAASGRPCLVKPFEAAQVREILDAAPASVEGA